MIDTCKLYLLYPSSNYHRKMVFDVDLMYPIFIKKLKHK